MFRMGIAPINMEFGRWTRQDIGERTCPFCPDCLEDELHVFWCARYFHLCDCGDKEVHVGHVDEDILLLLATMNGQTCEYIHHAMLIWRQHHDAEHTLTH